MFYLVGLSLRDAGRALHCGSAGNRLCRRDHGAGCFVIMLLNVEQVESRRPRLGFLVPAAIGLAAVLIRQNRFHSYFGQLYLRLRLPTFQISG